MQQTEQGVSFDEMMNMLANVQRRTLLFEVLEQGPQTDSPVVVGDSDDDPDVVADLVTMRHAHLPKLADYGLVEWNRDTHEVTKGPNFDDIKPLLELLDDHDVELPPDET